jgi:hypothetical protein
MAGMKCVLNRLNTQDGTGEWRSCHRQRLQTWLLPAAITPPRIARVGVKMSW